MAYLPMDHCGADGPRFGRRHMYLDRQESNVGMHSRFSSPEKKPLTSLYGLRADRQVTEVQSPSRPLILQVYA